MEQTIQLSDHFGYRRLIRFTIPSILMMIFTSIYGVVDGFFVSNFVGKTSFAAVNFIMPFLMITGVMGFMFGTGGSALIAKIMGEGKKEKAQKIFSLLIYWLRYLWNCNWSNQHNFSQTSSRISWSKRRDAGRMYYIWKNYSRSIAIPYVTVRIFKPGCYRRKAETGIDCDSYCRCDKYGW